VGCAGSARSLGLRGIAWSRGNRLFPRRDAEQLAAMIPRATLHWIDDALIFRSLDQPGEVAA
jgi:hypothetical protein